MMDGRWQLRFSHVTDDSLVCWTTVELETGGIVSTPGCSAGLTGGAGFQAAGCRAHVP